VFANYFIVRTYGAMQSQLWAIPVFLVLVILLQDFLHKVFVGIWRLEIGSAGPHDLERGY
jgi:hypothetical protein